MRSFIFAAFILSYSSATAQLSTQVIYKESSSMPSGDVIYYNAAKNLNWDNFQGKPPGDEGIVAALTVSGFGYNAGMVSKNGKAELNVTVYCYFNKKKSWVKPGKNTAYILTHEQHHFDVSFISACIFMDKVKSKKLTAENVKEVLPRLYNESCDIMNKMQNDYDGQTKNGQVEKEQLRWNNLIDSRIVTFTK